MLIYVDDIIVTSNDVIAIDSLISNLDSKFVIKDLRPLSILFNRHSCDQHRKWLAYTPKKICY
jgi:hypothetical protein